MDKHPAGKQHPKRGKKIVTKMETMTVTKVETKKKLRTISSIFSLMKR